MGLLSRLLPRRGTTKVSVPPAVAERAAEHLLEMDETLERMAALAGLEDFRATRRVPAELFELLRTALAAYDRYVETIVAGAGLATTCQRGCTACCHDVPTGVQAVELLHIYLAMRELPDFVDVHNRACDLADELFRLLEARAGAGSVVQSDGPEYRAAQLEYRARHLPCAFLDERGACRIYEQRPIPCRMHFSLSDPAWCRIDHERAAQAVTPNFEPPDDALSHLRTAARRLGLEGLSPSLFQGLAVLGGSIMATERLGLDRRPTPPGGEDPPA